MFKFKSAYRSFRTEGTRPGVTLGKQPEDVLAVAFANPATKVDGGKFVRT